MSDNKNKYFEVTTTAVVAANNKSDAEALARGRRGIQGTTLASGTYVERLNATQARELAEEIL